MSNYTELFFRAKFRRDVPPELLDWFDRLANDENAPVEPYDDHPLFGLKNWQWPILGADEIAFPLIAPALQFTRGVEGQPWSQPRLVIHSSAPDRGKVSAFVDWITPYVAALPGELLGYSLYEDTDGDKPQLIFMQKQESTNR